jgi:predicted nucleic acid-binding protein
VRRWTVDASVALKWFIPEVHSEAAKLLLEPNFELVAPDLIYSESGNVLWKKFNRNELSASEVQAVRGAIEAVPFQVLPGKDLLESAIELAIALTRTVYDCMYLAVAVGMKAPLVTADRKLYRALAAGPFSQHVHWVEDTFRV